jgi:AcrR family transcriptional regulator
MLYTVSTTSSSAPPKDPGTRDRILQAAWWVLEDRGPEARISDIAERAAVSRQAVYLHFGDRPRLLIALLDFMDSTLGVQEMAEHVFAAPSGPEMLDRTVELNAALAPRIDKVAQVLEAAQTRDEDMAAAWRSRMDIRRSAHRLTVQRIADERRLSADWTVEAAADLVSASMLPALWRELTGHAGWTADDYRERMTRFLRNALLT